MFSGGYPTNRIPVMVPSTGQVIVLRETTVAELKSMGKTIIDNLNRRQMDIIYDATTEYLQAMILPPTDGSPTPYVAEFTEFDRLFCLMVFFQLSFFRDPINHKCKHCGVDIVYRYDMSKYIKGMEGAYVCDQDVEIPFKSRLYKFKLGWPSAKTMSAVYKHFYTELGDVTEEMESTQLGIHFVLSFVKRVEVLNVTSGGTEAELDLDSLQSFSDRLDCLNALPSMVTFDEDNGVFSKITGMFVNRLENCFSTEMCPQCHNDTGYGLSNSALFYSLFYGMLRSLYGFCIQVEVLCLYRYGTCIFDKEQYMTYNDLQTLVHQLQTIEERDNDERKKVGKENFTKGLWLIREILNTMVFPMDKHKPG